MQELVNHLHANDQHYVVMVDPAVAYQPYPPFERGVQDNIFMLRSNGSIWKGVVWPGVTAFPDWFSQNISTYWENEFAVFFSPASGVDIDALWIDMSTSSRVHNPLSQSVLIQTSIVPLSATKANVYSPLQSNC